MHYRMRQRHSPEPAKNRSGRPSTNRPAFARCLSSYRAPNGSPGALPVLPGVGSGTRNFIRRWVRLIMTLRYSPLNCVDEPRNISN